MNDIDQQAGRKDRKHKWLRWILACGIALALCAGGAYYYLRFVRVNFHVVIEGQVYRSAQPGGETLLGWIRSRGLKTIVNLRGSVSDAERAATKEGGATLVVIRFSAYRLPSLPSLRKLIEVLETADRPILLHCRAGADRTSMASVLAAMAIGGQDYQAASSQLSMRYLRLDGSPQRIAGFLQRYEAYCRKEKIDTGGWKQFRRWAMETYRTYYYYVRIDAPRKLSARPGEVLRVRLVIRNDSHETIPASDPDKTFTLAAFTGSSEQDDPDREFGRVILPKRDIPPGGSVSLDYTFAAPSQAGVYRLRFDLIEENRTWFARQGSPVPTCELVVSGE